ncbi:MAG: hypothetical protein R2799_00315 [Crocinitomicaceae bacterium]
MKKLLPVIMALSVCAHIWSHDTDKAISFSTPNSNWIQTFQDHSSDSGTSAETTVDSIAQTKKENQQEKDKLDSNKMTLLLLLGVIPIALIMYLILKRRVK